MDQAGIVALVKETMQATQVQMLEMAATNAKAIAEEKNRQTASKLQEALEEKEETKKLFGEHVWKNDINKSNFKFGKQVHDMWEKTERAVKDNDEAKALECINEGKKLSRERLKVLRYADTEGWDAAFNYMSDDLAENEQDRKRMEKSKKKAEATKSSKRRSATHAFSRKDTDGWKGRGGNLKTNNQQRSSGDFGKKRKWYETEERRDENLTCYTCGKLGHRAANCRSRERHERY